MNEHLFFKEVERIEKDQKKPKTEIERLKLDLEIMQDDRCKAQLRNLIKELEE